MSAGRRIHLTFPGNRPADILHAGSPVDILLGILPEGIPGPDILHSLPADRTAAVLGIRRILQRILLVAERKGCSRGRLAVRKLPAAGRAC